MTQTDETPPILELSEAERLSHPERPYDAVGESGRRGALVSFVLAGVAVVAVIIVLFTIGSNDVTETETPRETRTGDTNKEQPREFTVDPLFQAGNAAENGIFVGATDLKAVADCNDCPLMVPVPPGKAAMGITKEEAFQHKVPRLHIESELPRHGVTITETFALGLTEVTRQQFEAFVESTDHVAEGCTVLTTAGWIHDAAKNWRDPGFEQDDTHPVVCVSHADATAYVEWLSEITGRRYRLPSETEWEYVARAGYPSTRFWGNDAAAACAFANVAGKSHHAAFSKEPRDAVFPCDSGYVYTAPAGTFKPSPFGQTGMFGNVREIVADCWNPNHWGKGLGGAPRTDGACNAAVVKGGGWDDAPHNVRASRRFKAGRDDRRADQGFRVAKDMPVVIEAE